MSSAPSLAEIMPPETTLSENGDKAIIMLGAGGHARVLQETLAELGIELAGYIAPAGSESQLLGVPWLGDDSQLADLDPRAVELVNGVGSVRAPQLRREVYQAAKRAGFRFRTVVDASARVKNTARLGEGVQVLVGAIVGTGVVLSEDVIINSGAIIDHDCVMEAHCHISPGAIVAGGVRVGEVSHIGLGARVIQGVTIGSNCIVGAGAVVIRDVPDSTTALGIPAAHRPTH